jgi:hypothetical protein
MLKPEAKLVNKLLWISSALYNCLYNSHFQPRHNRVFSAADGRPFVRHLLPMR